MDIVFYEIEHGFGRDHFLFERNTNHSFPLHMHRCFEMVLMLEGEMNMRVDGEHYTLTEGDLLLVKPNRIHSYETEEGRGGTCLLCVFSEDLIAAISDSLIRYRLSSPVLRGVEPLYRDIFRHMEGRDDIASVKGFLYLLCGLFCGQLSDTGEDVYTGDSLLLHHIFQYIETNVNNPCTLYQLAKELKYNESYLSRVFLKSVGISFSEYVRNIKINHACYLLRNTKESVYSIAMKCGYATQSSFCRCFKQLVGVTPHEYRGAND